MATQKKNAVIGWNHAPVHISYEVEERVDSTIFKGTAHFTSPIQFSFQVFSNTQTVFSPADIDDLYRDLITDVILKEYESEKQQN